MDIERKSFKAHVKSVEDRTVTQIFSVFDVIDSYQERVKPGAFKKTISERMDRIKVLWQHNYYQPPIATLDAAREIERGDIPSEVLKEFPSATGALEADVTYLNTDRGEEILVGIKEGAITENSIGFDVIQEKMTEIEVSEVKLKVRDLIEVRLWDLSPVNWGANPATYMVNSAIPFESTGTIKETQLTSFLNCFTQKNWEDLPEEERVRISKHFAWSDNLFPANFDGLKLPHHQPYRSPKVGPASEGGVKQSMNMLLRAELQLNEKEGVHDHLAKHYFELGEQAPSYKLVELAYTVKDALNMEECDLKSCFEELQALNAKLREAEPDVAIEAATTHFELERARVRTLIHFVDSV